jgi:aconitate hydratase 2/2-methylisocitrate dehydratase
VNEVKVPILCCPNDPDEAKFLSEVAGTKIDEALENLGGLRSGIFWPASDLV